MQRINCWDFKKCGIQEKCPAYPNHGRNCFAVTGSWCGGELQGSYAEKVEKCRTTCKFYQGMMDGTLDLKVAS